MQQFLNLLINLFFNLNSHLNAVFVLTF